MTPTQTKENQDRTPEAGETTPRATQTGNGTGGTGSRRVLVIDDSLMLLGFVRETLGKAGYEVSTAATAAEALTAVKANTPELILLDHLLPEEESEQVRQGLTGDPATKEVPVLYMSGLGEASKSEKPALPNVIGTLNKPFTSDLLIKTVETHMPNPSNEPEPAPPQDETPAAINPPEEEAHAPQPVEASPFEQPAAAAPAPVEDWWSTPPAASSPDPWGGPSPFEPPQTEEPEPTPEMSFMPNAPEAAAAAAATAATAFAPAPEFAATPAPAAMEAANVPDETVTGGAYFCGDTSFFSLNWALQTISKGSLTGTLRCYSASAEPVEILVRKGEIVIATTRDSNLYCPEQPISLANIDPEEITEARNHQRETGQPMFLALTDRSLLLQEPALQLVQHYGQKLVCPLWTAAKVRFLFEQADSLPAYAANLPAESDVDHWALATLRLLQYPDLGNKGNYDSNSIPGYTRDGFERIQNLRLTVSEAQFGSQFNGVRSIAQIAKNLRLDVKFARLTLFRFLALEIVELWPPTAQAKPESKGVLQRLTKKIGFGD